MEKHRLGSCRGHFILWRFAMSTYSYVRVSDVSQHEDRQLIAMDALGIPRENIFIDKQSGKNTARPGLQRLMATVNCGDTIVVESEETPKAAASPQARRRATPRAARVITIDDQRNVETPDDKARNDLIDLVESQKNGKILTGTLQGVERNPETPDIIMAVLYHGDFKVIIPVEEAMAPPRTFRDRNHSDVLHYLLSKRLGSEFDYIVKGVDADNRIAAASRLEAMAVKRRLYYNGARSALKEGATAEARVACVIRTGAFVEIFGAETFIPLRELSYQRWMDAAQHYQAGQRVLVKILSVDRKSADDVTVEASIKQVGENPYEKALRRYTVGNQYVGSVSVVDTTGVFVSLDGGIDCLCTFPRRGRPPRGSRVTVRIRGINYEANRIWGSITHMTTH